MLSATTFDPPYLDVRRAGVTLDGVSDDTPGWRRAFAAFPACGPLVMPPGTSLITETLQAPPRLILRGAGEASVLAWRGQAGGYLLDLSGAHAGRLSDLAVMGATAAPGSRVGRGILCSGSFGWLFDHVFLESLEVGMRCEKNAGDNHLLDVKTQLCDTGMELASTMNYLRGGIFDSCTTGIVATAYAGLWATHTTWGSGLGQAAQVHVDLPQYGNVYSFIHCWFELATEVCLRAGDGAGVGPAGLILRDCFLGSPTTGVVCDLRQGLHSYSLENCEFIDGSIINVQAGVPLGYLSSPVKQGTLQVNDASGVLVMRA
jgi:hypothetical protein